MNPIRELLQRKRADVDARKKDRRPVVPKGDRRVNWDRNDFRIIAEIKRSSPSAGSIRNISDPVVLARAYEDAGADAISILTEEYYFRGSIEDLRAVRGAVQIPLLQKDFVIDSYQILEAKEAGADFVLLIARFLTTAEITEFLQLCDNIQINAIVEVTDEEDLAKVTLPVRFLGVNSRDLETLQVDPARFERLRSKLPDAFLIAESGIHSLEELQRVKGLGYHGALIGEHFLRAEDPAKELAKFAHKYARGAINGAPTSQRGVTNVKICGITSERDAMNAIDAGASALGFVFAESPRRIAPETFKEFRRKVSVPCVGVFRGNPSIEIRSILETCELNIAQIYSVGARFIAPFAPTIDIWRARMLRSLEEVERAAPEGQQLLDIKLPENEMESAWEMLKGKNVFALAGGLHSENVGRAVRLCGPQWIDVARGVEKEPGIKDAEKMRNFIKAVNRK